MSERSPFYVGYLALPRPLGSFLRALVPTALAMGGLAAALLAISQRDPGEAVWEGDQSELEGALFERPYPHLVHDDGRVTLLVEMGKVGAQRAARGLDAQRVRATGWSLRRDGRRILELDPEAPLERLGGSGQSSPLAAAPGPGEVTVTGEIVDSKCYLGAMKPGDGLAHRACAALCIRGGIPPTLVAHLPDGSRRYLLVLNGDGGPMPEELVARVGERVELAGSVVRAEGFEAIRATRWRPTERGL